MENLEHVCKYFINNVNFLFRSYIFFYYTNLLHQRKCLAFMKNHNKDVYNFVPVTAGTKLSKQIVKAVAKSPRWGIRHRSLNRRWCHEGTLGVSHRNRYSLLTCNEESLCTYSPCVPNITQ